VKSAAELAATLRRETQLLEALSFRLWTLRSVLSGESDSSLPAALAEVKDTLLKLRKAELSRAIDVSALTGDLHVGTDAPLIELAATAAEPWSSRLSAHHASLATGVIGIDALASEISHLLLANTDDLGMQDGLANQLVDQAVPRSLVWFLRLPAGAGQRIN
jgi:hypothetical protein